MADVIAIVVDVVTTIKQLEYIFMVADVIATYCYLIGWCYCQCGQCYCHLFYSVLADVIAMVVDVKTTQGDVNMTDVIAICGWCYYHSQHLF